MNKASFFPIGENSSVSAGSAISVLAGICNSCQMKEFKVSISRTAVYPFSLAYAGISRSSVRFPISAKALKKQFTII